MLSTPQGNAFFIMAVLVLVSLLLAMEGGYLLWRSHKGPQARKLQRRLRALSATRDSSTATGLLRDRIMSELPAIERILRRMPRMRALDRFIQQSGLNWTVSKLLLACAGAAIIGWMLARAVGQAPLVLGLLAAVLLGLAPLLFVQRKRHTRLAKIERQLPDALDLLTRALRAGHAFSSGLKMAAEELAEPIASEFSTVHDEVNFGVSLQQALTHMSDRIPLTDVRYFVVAVLIQRESGGNLTEILGNLARLIRDRLKLMAKVRVLSSEGRMSAWILAVMPFALGAVMYAVNPKFMSPLWTDPIGVAIIQYMLSLMAVGILILRKIIQIRV